MPLFPRDLEDVPVATVSEPEPEPVPLAGVPGGAADGVRRLAEHRAFLAGNVPGLRPLGIGLLDAFGLALCESIVADLDLPTFTSATVDGWAVRSSDLNGADSRRPVVLPVVARVEPGALPGGQLPPGMVAQLAAGGPVPEGADAVVPIDDAEPVGDEVRFTTEAGVHQHLLLAGSRVSDGELLAGPGAELTPRLLGLIAEVGHDKVLARPRPRVVVMTADRALVEPGLPLTRVTQSYDACTTLLAASARRDGAQVFSAGLVPAEPLALARALGEQLVRADLVLLVAEVTDELISALARQGAVDAAEVDGVPGRQLFGLLGPDLAPVLVLPPGPVPAYLAYLQSGRALVRRLAGVPDASSPEAEPVVVAEELVADPVRTRLLLARRTPAGFVPIPDRQPGAAALARADVVLVVPPGDRRVPAGSTLPAWSLD